MTGDDEWTGQNGRKTKLVIASRISGLKSEVSSLMAITAEQAIKAVDGSGGYVSVIAKRLGCTVRQVYNLRDKYTSVKEAIDDEREKQKDFAEGKLQQRIKEGSDTAIIFYLKTQAKDRGYIERQELTGKDGENLPATRIEIVNAPQPK